MASQEIYNFLGIPAPEGYMLDGGELVNPWMEHTPLDKAQLKAELDGNPEQAGKLFAAAVATSNWDHVGLVYDNMVLTPDGRLAVVDHGGTFEFRAQGGHKEYTGNATEIDSLLDPKLGTQSASVFSDVAKTPEFRKAAKDAFASLYDAVVDKRIDLDTSIGNKGNTFLAKVNDAFVKIDDLPKGLGSIGKETQPHTIRKGARPTPTTPESEAALFAEMEANTKGLKRPQAGSPRGLTIEGEKVRVPGNPWDVTRRARENRQRTFPAFTTRAHGSPNTGSQKVTLPSSIEGKLNKKTGKWEGESPTPSTPEGEAALFAEMQKKLGEVDPKYTPTGPTGINVTEAPAKAPRAPRRKPLAPETLVTPREIETGLTGGEKAGNVITTIKKFLIGHGVKNDATATPVAKEYLRINNVLKNQANQLGKVVARAERLGIIDPETLKIDRTNLNPDQLRIADSIERSMNSWRSTLSQFGSKMTDIDKFIKKLRTEAGNENKSLADMYQEYANAIANKAADRWLGGEVNKLGKGMEMIQDVKQKSGSAQIPTRSVNLPGAKKTKLPPHIADVIGQATRKVHPHPSSDATQLFNGINNTLRGLWASLDASFIGIQQLPTWADNPKLAGQVTKGSIDTLRDPTAFAEYSTRMDEIARETGRPTGAEYVDGGLQVAQATGEGTDIGGIGGAVQRIPVYGKLQKLTNRMFTESGNFNRRMLADNLWDRMDSGIPIVHGLDPKNMTRAQKIEAIAKAANRSTGFADRPFGGAYGSALFFAPRFMQSQLEMIIKAASDGSVEGQVARRQLLKLIGAGTAITVGFNEFRGEDTEFDPRSSNFMRIKNIGGVDISVFGPWDTLVKGVIRSVPHVDANGDFTLGEPDYLLRSKLSPVLSTTVDMISGTNVLGDQARPGLSKSPGENALLIKNLISPFGLRKIGTEPVTATALGLLGGKGTPLSDSENLVNKLESVGIKESDPDFLIKKREWMKAHPDAVPKADRGDFKRSQELSEDIAARRKLNDDLTASNGQSLTAFREKRKILLAEQRNRRAEIMKSSSNLKGPNARWLNSYFRLFDDKDLTDPITGEIDPDKFDEATAKWSNQNGAEALNFVNEYLGAGLNPVEKQYYTDMQTLEKAGYFDKPRYQNMQSDLSEDEIDALAKRVDAIRVENPALQDESWDRTAKRLLSSGIDDEQLLDVLHSRKEKYQSEELADLKVQYGKEILWFNPRAFWSSYENFTPGQKSSGGTSPGFTTRASRNRGRS
jgi:hypothetical protein